MKKLPLILICMLTIQFVMAQQGKDGAANITTTSTVNIYTPLVANAATGVTSITVASTAGFSAGDLIYIIQMQGATVRDSVYYWGNPNSDLINDTAFGKIRAYNGAGNNEFAEITSVVGNIITIDCALKNSYSDTTYPHPGNTQIVRVPRYTTLTLSGVGQITCLPWNGHTGGVVVIEVQGNTSIGTGTSINAVGMGFRGGAVLNATGFGATNTGSSFGSTGSNNGAHKGESIAGDTNVYKKYNYNSNFYSGSTPLATCKGNVANGGGGGNVNNCGGGGGSNGGVISNWNGMGNADVSTANNIAAWNQESTTPVNGSFRPTTSSGGGRGGYAYSDNNSDPTTTAPGYTVWVGDDRHNDGGWGGTPLDYSTGRIFLGGGGGAGDSNDGNGTSGGNGGGIVYLLSYGTVTGAGKIIADGATAQNTNTATTTFDEAFAQGDDGAGGGGGGGGVVINSTGNIALTNTLAISAQGGIGGDYFMHNTGGSKNFGPGGGGGGGYVATTNTVSGVNVNGGANGIVAGAAQGSSNASKIAIKFPPNGATAGGAGTITTTLTPNFYLTAANYTICASSALSLSVTVNGTTPSGLSILWYTVATGGTSVFTGNPYAITSPATAGTYTYYAGTCPGTYRIPIIVTVTSASGPVLTIGATKTTTCSGLSDTLSVTSSATSYTWSANVGSVQTGSVIVTPTVNTTYTVTGSTTGACAGTGTASISITISPPPTITITPTSNSLCIGSSTTLTASGANTYTWIPSTGMSTTTGSVVTSTPTVTTTYTVTGTTATGCTGTKTITINVNPPPTITVNSPSVCGGGSATLTATGAVNYTWAPSTGLSATTGSVVTATPSVTTNYTVTGTDANGCSSLATSTVTITSNPAVVVNSATLCVGDSTMLTTSGANTYTWSPATGLSATTGTMVMASPSVTTTYTVAGSVGTCTATPGTTTITVNRIPTITISNATATICSGTSTTLTANGANTYSWALSIGLSATTGSMVTATPSVTTAYTVTGTDINSCKNTTVTTISVNPSPTATVSSATTICSGDSAVLTAGGATTYSWIPSSGLSTTTGTMVMASPSVTTTYSVTGTTGSCPSTNTISITVVSSPSISVNSATMCVGQSTTLTATGTASSYTWSPSGSLSGSSGGTVTATPSVTTSYTITGTLGTCTATPFITTVTVNTPPTLTLTPVSATLCSGDSTTFTVSGANTYTWVPSLSLSVISTSVAIAHPTTNTNYTVSGTALNGCISGAVATVSVNTTPVVSVNSATICAGNSTTLTATGATSYSWTPSTGLSVTNANIVTANPANTTTYVVRGTSGNCSSIDSAIVIVIPTPILLVNSPGAICLGSSATLTASGAVNYTWTPSATLSSSNGGTVTATPITTTIYTVSGSVTTCSANPVVVTLSVTPLPTVSVTPTATICAGGSFSSATLIATGNATSYSWAPASGLSATTGSMVITNPSVPTQYIVTGSLNSCTATATSIIITTTLQASFIPTPDAGNAPLNVQFINTSNGGTNYVWNYGNGLNQNTINLADTSGTIYNNSGIYTVTLTASNALGCTNTYTTTITVLQSYSITIPNVFSPNGDGINDVFDVKAMGVTSLNCDVFDRWGLKLYSFNSVAGYWDGSSKGGKEVDGTYFYVIQATDTKGDNHKYNGFITLIR